MKIFYFIAGFILGFGVFAIAHAEETVTMSVSITTVSPKDAITADANGLCWIDRVQVDCNSHDEVQR